MPAYDCKKCPGYCCSYGRISVTKRDIARLAKFFGTTLAKARKRFTYRYVADDVDEWILRHRKDTIFRTVCRFLDPKTRRCTIYAARPQVCRQYPYGTKCGYYDFLEFEREQQGDDEAIPDL